MSDAILVLNAGPSDLKFSIFQAAGDDLTCITRGEVLGLGGIAHLRASHRTRGIVSDEDLGPSLSNASSLHLEALAYLTKWIREEFAGAFSVIAIGHHIAHGGDQFVKPTLITQQIIEKLSEFIPFAPQQQLGHLSAVRATRELLPQLPQVACFDTAFHQDRPVVSQRYGLPDELFRSGVRRWGVHGLAYTSVVDQLRETAPDLLSGRIIVANLGAQASMCAIHAGRSVDTSVGFSVLDGLPSGTRSGAIDSGALLYLLQSHTFREVENLLNCKSGLLGVSGISGDLCELLASEHPRAAEAVDFFVYRAVREIGSLTAALGGLDALIFTGSAGEASPLVRHRVTEPLRWLGIAVDKAANNRGRGCISPAGRSPSVWVVPSDEDSVVAVATRECVGGSAAKPPRRPTSVAEGVN